MINKEEYIIDNELDMTVDNLHDNLEDNPSYLAHDITNSVESCYEDNGDVGDTKFYNMCKDMAVNRIKDEDILYEVLDIIKEYY